MDEATALLETITRTPPHAPTACDGWRCHELVAHLAAGAAEMATHTERALTGAPPLATTDHARREAPFVAMADDELRTRLVSEALRLQAAVDAVRRTGAPVHFAGRAMAPDEITLHGRSEAALHRWDLAGDDDTGDDLLSQPELTEHAVTVLNSMVSGSPESTASRVPPMGPVRWPFPLTVASPGRPDVALVFDTTGPRLELAEPCRHPVAVADPAARLLALWGRRSERAVTWTTDGDGAELLARFLWGRSDRVVAAH